MPKIRGLNIDSAHTRENLKTQDGSGRRRYFNQHIQATDRKDEKVMRQIELMTNDQLQRKNLKQNIDKYMIHRKQDASRDRMRPVTNQKGRLGNLQIVRHGRDLRDFYGFGVSIPVTSKGVPKLLEKLNPKQDPASAHRGIKSIAQQEIELRLKHGQPSELNDDVQKQFNSKFIKQSRNAVSPQHWNQEFTSSTYQSNLSTPRQANFKKKRVSCAPEVRTTLKGYHVAQSSPRYILSRE